MKNTKNTNQESKSSLLIGMNRLAFLALITAISFSSCKKDEVAEPAPTKDTSTVQLSTCPDADAILSITNVVGISSFFTLQTTTSFASFILPQGYDPNDSVGTVKLNGITYPRNTASMYIATMLPGTLYTALNNATQFVWEVTGNSSLGVSASNDTVGPMPLMTGFSSSKTIDSDKDYILEISGLSYADSILYTIETAAGDKKVSSIKGPNISECRFTALELDALGTGDMVAWVELKGDTERNVSGKKYCFRKRLVYSDQTFKIQ